MTKVPSGATRAKARFGSTSTLAYICSWMLQNTSTRPGVGEAHRPRLVRPGLPEVEGARGRGGEDVVHERVVVGELHRLTGDDDLQVGR